MRGTKRNGGLSAFFFRERMARPISRSEVEPPIMHISPPSHVERVAHISYRTATGLFSGLDSPISLFFGVPVTSQPRIEVEGYTERLPHILVLLAKELIRRDGLTSEGIFRVPGESTAVQRSRDTLNTGKGMLTLDAEVGPNLIASLIKDWFRSLPSDETLLMKIPTSEMQKLAKDDVSEEQAYNTVIALLSEPSRSIFNWIIDLLAVVCVHKEANRMSPHALATVFAPTLFTTEVALDSFALIGDVAKVIEKCILFSLSRGNMDQKESVFAN